MATSGTTSKALQLKVSKYTAMAAAIVSPRATVSEAGSSENHERRPPYSYVALITMAIEDSPNKRATLSEICQFILDKFPYYRDRQTKMKNSIKHNLSLNKCCVRLPLQEDQNGKSCYWVIDPQYRNMFHGGSYRRRKVPHTEYATAVIGNKTPQIRRILASTIAARKSPSAISTSASLPFVVSTVPTRKQHVARSTLVEDATTTTIVHHPTCNSEDSAVSSIVEVTTSVAHRPTCNKDGASAIAEATTTVKHQATSTALSIPLGNADSSVAEPTIITAQQPTSTDLSSPLCNADSEMVTTTHKHQPTSTFISVPLCNADSSVLDVSAAAQHRPTSMVLSTSPYNADSNLHVAETTGTITTVAHHQPTTLPLTPSLPTSDVAYSSLETLLKTGTLTTVFAAGSEKRPVHALTAPVPNEDGSNRSSQPRVLLIPFGTGVYTAAPVLASAVSLVPVQMPSNEFREIQEPQRRLLGSKESAGSSMDIPTSPANVHATSSNGAAVTSTLRDIVISPVSSMPYGVGDVQTCFVSNGDVHANLCPGPSAEHTATNSTPTRSIHEQVGSTVSGIDTLTVHPSPGPNQSPSEGTQATSGNLSQHGSENTTESTSLSDKRPPYSYVALITMAIESMPLKRAMLGDICNFISEHFPYYRERDAWKSYIRHTLSVNRCFVRLAQGFREPGSNSYWIVDPAYRNMFTGGTYRRRNFAFHDLPMYTGATEERQKRREIMRLANSQRWERNLHPSALFTAGQMKSFPLHQRSEFSCNATVRGGMETTPLQ